MKIITICLKKKQKTTSSTLTPMWIYCYSWKIFSPALNTEFSPYTQKWIKVYTKQCHFVTLETSYIGVFVSMCHFLTKCKTKTHFETTAFSLKPKRKKQFVNKQASWLCLKPPRIFFFVLDTIFLHIPLFTPLNSELSLFGLYVSVFFE